MASDEPTRRILRALEPALPLVLILVLAAALGGLGYLLLFALKGVNGFTAEAWRLLVVLPWSAAKTFSIAMLLLILAAGALTPLAWLETRSARAFARREEELRRERPGDALTPYHGEEGEGVAFDGPEGRILLLKPVAGVGAPRVVVIPNPVTAHDAAPAHEPAPDAPSSS